ncbi:MAG: methyltransferase domain-containing protein [Ardenticatenales bacterium]|nr:methyltransferase domain-containing protein [Ardenticatenales bacterium]
MAATTLPYARSTPHDDVDWHSYAAVYDVMAEHNPAYRALVDGYRRFLAALQLRAGDTLVELGAGTGNYSLAAAKAWPKCHVVHVDASDAMNAHAITKRTALGLGNVEILTADVDAFDLPDESVALVTAVHSLYAFRDPVAVIAKCSRWLRPGGQIFAIDPGAPIDVREWSRYVFREACRSSGVATAIGLFWRARSAVRHNQRIADAFKGGTYWRHDAATFRAAFLAGGFEIVEAETTFRGASDLIVGRKPLRPVRTAHADDPAADDAFEAAV